QALQDAPYELGRCLWCGLVRLAAESTNSVRHVARGEEARVTSGDERGERLRAFGHGHQFVVLVLNAFGLPLPAALLEKPEPDDIPEETNRSSKADLVREIRLTRFVGEQGSRQFYADETPSAR